MKCFSPGAARTSSLIPFLWITEFSHQHGTDILDIKLSLLKLSSSEKMIIVLNPERIGQICWTRRCNPFLLQAFFQIFTALSLPDYTGSSPCLPGRPAAWIRSHPDHVFFRFKITPAWNVHNRQPFDPLWDTLPDQTSLHCGALVYKSRCRILFTASFASLHTAESFYAVHILQLIYSTSRIADNRLHLVDLHFEN